MIETLTDDELIRRLKDHVADERKSLKVFLEHLIEFDRRRLCEDSAYPSLFWYLTKELGLAEGEAYKRIRTARAAKRFPLILDLLERGLIHISAVAILSAHLSPENHVHLLKRAQGLSARELEFMVAGLNPRPAQADVIAATSAPTISSTRGFSANSMLSTANAPQTDVQAHPAGAGASAAKVQGVSAADLPGVTSSEAAVVALAASRALEKITATSETAARVSFTGPRRLLEKIERARNILRRASTCVTLSQVFEAALDAFLSLKDRECQPQAQCRAVLPGRRRVPKWVRQSVWKRDGGRCTFRTQKGQRCESRTWLEYDHIVPFALGGVSDSAENIRLLCRAHNQSAARLQFGSPIEHPLKQRLK